VTSKWDSLPDNIRGVLKDNKINIEAAIWRIFNQKMFYQESCHLDRNIQKNESEANNYVKRI